MRAPVGLELPDVPPVSGLLVRLDPGDDVRLKIVGEDPRGRDQGRDDALPEVVIGVLSRVGEDRVHEDAPGEQVVPHRHERDLAVARHGTRRRRLLDEVDHAPGRVDREVAEAGGLGQRHRAGRHRDVRVVLPVERHHLVHVHAVDVVRAEHGHQVGVEVVDEVQVLEDSVGAATEPHFPDAHLRGHDGDEVVRHEAAGLPGGTEVLDQRLRHVLDEDVERQDPRVDEVREDEVDDPVAAAERHRGLAALAGQGLETRAFASGEDQGENAVSRHRWALWVPGIRVAWRPGVYQGAPGLSITTLSGGSVSVMDHGCPVQGRASAWTPPALPTLLPP